MLDNLFSFTLLGSFAGVKVHCRYSRFRQGTEHDRRREASRRWWMRPCDDVLRRCH